MRSRPQLMLFGGSVTIRLWEGEIGASVIVIIVVISAVSFVEAGRRLDEQNTDHGRTCYRQIRDFTRAHDAILLSETRHDVFIIPGV